MQTVAITRMPLLIILYLLGIFSPNFLHMSSFFGVNLPENLPNEDFKKDIIKKYRKEFSLYCGIYIILFFLVLVYNNSDGVFTTGLILFSIIWIILFNVGQYRTRKYLKNMTKVGKKKTAQASKKQVTTPTYLISPVYFIFPLILILINIFINIGKFSSLPNKIPVFWSILSFNAIYLSKALDIILIHPMIMLFVLLLSLLIYKNLGPSSSNIKLNIILCRLTALWSSIAVIIGTLFNFKSIGILSISANALMISFYIFIILMILSIIYTFFSNRVKK